MELRYLILFVISAMLIACDAQSSTEEPDLTSSAAVSPTENDSPAIVEAASVKTTSGAVPSAAPLEETSTKPEEMQKDAPAAAPETTTTEATSEEKVTTEATTTPKAATIAPTRPTIKGPTDFPPLVHSNPTEETKSPMKNSTEKTDTVTKPDGNKNGSSPIHSSITLILGLTGMVFRYQSY